MKLVSAGSAVIALAFLLGAPACKKSPDATEKKSEPSGSAKATTTPSATPTAKVIAKKDDGIPAPSNVAEAPANAVAEKSGLKSLVLQAGTGTVHPKAADKVKVHYTGWSKDGKMFDSSVVRKSPSTFGLNQVIKGWTEGVQLMVVGEKRRFWIPGDLAYGETPRRPGAPAGQLTFDIELLDVMPAPEPPKTPEDVAAAPKNAKKTKSGLAYRVLTKGTGKVHPTATQTVQVHYSGWTTDGKLFDSSITSGEPATFGLNRVIPGWTEGVQLMVEGEKTRFWIPGPLAYGDKPQRPGVPSGTLVFDIELLKIVGGPAASPH